MLDCDTFNLEIHWNLNYVFFYYTIAYLHLSQLLKLISNPTVNLVINLIKFINESVVIEILPTSNDLAKNTHLGTKVTQKLLPWFRHTIQYNELWNGPLWSYNIRNCLPSHSI